MMRLIRWILGNLILFFDRTFSPRPLERTPDAQAKVDQATRSLALYQFEACPFCVKVRRAMRRLNLNIELRDARNVPAYTQELVKGGGSVQVPCLKITEPNGSVRWMYESSDINQYLSERFGDSPTKL